MKRKLAMMAVAFAIAAPTFAQSQGAAERDVLKVNSEYSEALIRADVAALGRLVADDFISTTPTGEVFDKAQSLARIKSGELTFDSGKDSDVRVRVYGDTAVVTGLWTSKGQMMGKPFENKERYTITFVKRGGRWQVVAEHVGPASPGA